MVRFEMPGFLKRDRGLSRGSESRSEGYPLFKRQRLLLLVFLLYFSCFLEAVSARLRDEGGQVDSHTLATRFPQINLSLWG